MENVFKTDFYLTNGPMFKAYLEYYHGFANQLELKGSVFEQDIWLMDSPSAIFLQGEEDAKKYLPQLKGATDWGTLPNRLWAAQVYASNYILGPYLTQTEDDAIALLQSRKALRKMVEEAKTGMDEIAANPEVLTDYLKGFLGNL